MTRFAMLAGGVALLSFMWGCATPPPPDTRAADEQVIREIETEWAKVVAAKDVERFMSFYADDASVFEPGTPIVTGKDAIRKTADALFAIPGLSVSFQTVKVEVSRSGDLAYSYGTNAMTMNDPKGKPLTDKGKYVTVYRKQPDGAWKAVADIRNSDLPAPAPPPKKK
jgi:uncharacterized protein (TIGR02246 family)